MNEIAVNRSHGPRPGPGTFGRAQAFFEDLRPGGNRFRVLAANITGSLTRPSDLDAFTQGWFKGV